MKNINDFNAYINDLVSDYEGEGGRSRRWLFLNYAHECADGSEYVIYYSKAWDLVNMIRANDYSLYCDSEEQAFHLGVDLDSLDHTITLVAYIIINKAMMAVFNNKAREA